MCYHNYSINKSKLITNDWIANKDAFHPLEQISSFNLETLKFLASKLGLKVYSQEQRKKNIFSLISDASTKILNTSKEKNRLVLYLKKD
jgi:hypothetical protein